MLIIINAQDKNRLIGNGMQIPWHVKDDFLHFKNTTLNHTIIMGKTTFESIGKPLPNRKTIIVHFDKNFDAMGCEVCTNLQELIYRYQNSEEIAYVCGGASIYKQLLPYCSKLIISFIKGDFQGNIFFPEYLNQFQEISRVDKGPFELVEYIKK